MPNEINVPEMLTIAETAKKTGLAAHYIRQCCLTNKIVHVRCGKRYLVNIPKLVEFLNTGDQTNQIENENEPPRIRRLG